MRFKGVRSKKGPLENRNIYLGSLTKEIYTECIKHINEKIREEKFHLLTTYSFLDHINFLNFNRSLNLYFYHVKIEKGFKIFDEKIHRNNLLNISMFQPQQLSRLMY